MDERLLNTAYQKLFEALHKGGIDQICQTAHELLGKPVLIVNEELRKLAQYPDKLLGDPLWDALWQNGAFTPEMVWQLRDDALMEKSEQSDVPTWVDWGLVKNIPRLVCNVKVEGVIEGYVGVFFQANTYDDLDVQITKLVSQTVGMELQKQQHTRSTRYPAIITTFISDLFQGMVKTEEELSRWEKSMSIRLKPPFYVAAIGGDDRVSTTLHYMRATLIASSNNIFGTVLEGRLYILFSEVNARQEYSEYFKGQVHQIADMLNMYSLSAGMSIPFDNLLDLENYKYQAERALELGKLYRPSGRIHSYRELAFENMLSYIRENITPENYLHPAIGVLEKYDGENHTEYLKTLSTYITCMCNPSRTIEKMHIHRNTLLYRLNKIVDLTNLDLGNMKQCALLLNNFYISEFSR